MGMIFEDLEDHERYAARRLPDRTSPPPGPKTPPPSRPTSVPARAAGARPTTIHQPRRAAQRPRTSGNSRMPAHYLLPPCPRGSQSSWTTFAKRSPGSLTTVPSPLAR
jgi:hypothetical protein